MDFELYQFIQILQKNTTKGRKLNFNQQTDFIFLMESVLFCLNTIIVVKVYVFVYDEVSIFIRGEFNFMNTFCFKD